MRDFGLAAIAACPAEARSPTDLLALTNDRLYDSEIIQAIKSDLPPFSGSGAMLGNQLLLAAIGTTV